MQSKVVGIGFHKTGTTTLEKCLRDLGYTPQASYPESVHIGHYYWNGQYKKLFERVKHHRSLSDGPWNFGDFYKHIDAAFPGSKFILTLRDPDSWFDSLRRWCTPPRSKQTSIRMFPNGARFHKRFFNNAGNSFEHLAGQYKLVYTNRNDAIREYFKDRPEDLLELDWSQHGWKELCEFLGKPVPNKPIPHLNRGRR